MQKIAALFMSIFILSLLSLAAFAINPMITAVFVEDPNEAANNLLNALNYTPPTENGTAIITINATADKLEVLVTINETGDVNSTLLSNSSNISLYTTDFFSTNEDYYVYFYDSINNRWEVFESMRNSFGIFALPINDSAFPGYYMIFKRKVPPVVFDDDPTPPE